MDQYEQIHEELEKDFDGLELLFGSVLKLEMNYADVIEPLYPSDTVESARGRIESQIEWLEKEQQREDSEYEHPSQIQGRAFDNLTC